MVKDPGAGNTENTLANALSYKYNNQLSDINGDLRPEQFIELIKTLVVYLQLRK